MSILVDFLILGIIALCTFIGYKRGLVRVALRLFSFFIAIIVALVLYRPVASIVMNHTNIGTGIQNAIVNSLLPEGVSPDDTVLVDDSISGIIGGAVETTVNTMAEDFTIQIVELGALLLIFLLVKLILRFVTALSDFVTNLPILKQFNEIRRFFIWLVPRSFVCIYNTCNCSLNVFYNKRRIHRCYQ